MILKSAGVNIMSPDYTEQFASVGRGQADEFFAGRPDCDGNGHTDSGTDSCQNDSGGPLVCAVDGKAVITGIVSRGHECARESFPGIYGEVFDYLSWINANSQTGTTGTGSTGTGSTGTGSTGTGTSGSDSGTSGQTSYFLLL